MFGRKTKLIKDLEKMLEAEHEDFKTIYEKNLALNDENSNLRSDNKRLRNEVCKLQSQVQKIGLVRESNGRFRKA